MNAPKRLAIDFDGTICEDQFPHIGAPKPGAREVLRLFRQLGYQVVIWSCRACHWDYDVYGGDPSQPVLDRDRVRAMVEWLDLHGIEYDEIDDGSKGKPGAHFYIDDKAIRFEDNWPQIAAQVLQAHVASQPAYTKKDGKLLHFRLPEIGKIDPVSDATGDPNGEGPYCA